MRLRVIAVGTRMPAWVDAAVEDYKRRLRGSWKFELEELPVARANEARRILARLSARDLVVPLDEHGEQFDTLELAHWLKAQRAAAQDVAFIIGGPDGLADEVLAKASRRWSLSRLTLPHALVRVVLAEQIYRASTVLAGHPYHRA